MKYSVNVRLNELTGQIFKVFSDETSTDDGTSLIGEARLRLGPAPRTTTTTWLPLMGSALPTPRLGELMFSLSYLQTAERLNLVVVKARNLRGINNVPGDFFVKVKNIFLSYSTAKNTNNQCSINFNSR